MTEGLNPKQEQVAIKVEVATEKDWETLKNLRLEAITGEDRKMFVATPESVLKEQERTEQEWRQDLSAKNIIEVLSYVGSRAVGMGHAVEQKEVGVWELGWGYVNKNFRGYNIQPKMIAMRLLEILKRGGKKVYVTIEVGNSISMQNLAYFGFAINNPPDIVVAGDGSKHIFMDLNNLNDPEVITKINEVLNAG